MLKEDYQIQGERFITRGPSQSQMKEKTQSAKTSILHDAQCTAAGLTAGKRERDNECKRSTRKKGRLRERPRADHSDLDRSSGVPRQTGGLWKNWPTTPRKTLKVTERLTRSYLLLGGKMVVWRQKDQSKKINNSGIGKSEGTTYIAISTTGEETFPGKTWESHAKGFSRSKAQD